MMDYVVRQSQEPIKTWKRGRKGDFKGRKSASRTRPPWGGKKDKSGGVAKSSFLREFSEIPQKKEKW